MPPPRMPRCWHASRGCIARAFCGILCAKRNWPVDRSGESMHSGVFVKVRNEVLQRVLAFRVCWLAALATAVPAFATTMEAMSVEQLTSASQAVVRGTVVRQLSRWNVDKTRILTETEIQVTEVLTPGVKVPSTILTIQPGGEVGDVGQKVAGTPTFSLSEDVVIFLEPRGTQFVVAGMAQGKYSVDAQSQMAVPQLEGLELLDKTGQRVVSRVSVLSLKELRRRVAAASAATKVPSPDNVYPSKPTTSPPVRK
jgi:hypothetical protein